MLNLFQYLENKKGKTIPLEYKVLNNLPLNESDLYINGNLALFLSDIKYLPNNLKVDGNLYLNHSDIIKLPNNLTVNGVLVISATVISDLPDNLIVNDNLYCLSTPLATKIKNEPSLLEKYSKQIKGHIYYL